ncbi:hypothetical protein ACFQY0_19470 [Haloferula chungangensis]|uniref:HEAT repeat domain-containing protein n=1 Tax=Haloferula chungangensis TaxID=1048331 RepID=A0ABW2LF21_9BACT
MKSYNVFLLIAAFCLCACNKHDIPKHDAELNNGNDTLRDKKSKLISDSSAGPRISLSRSELADEERTADILKTATTEELIAIFQNLNYKDPKKACELILSLPFSKQKILLRASVSELAKIDPLEAFEITNSLGAGNLRKECMWSVGREFSSDDFVKIGPNLAQLYPEDIVSLVHALNASTVQENEKIVRTLESSDIRGEALTTARTRFAYSLGASDLTDPNTKVVRNLNALEKEAFVNGMISNSPDAALRSALKFSENDPSFLKEVKGQLIASLFEENGPADTISHIASMQKFEGQGFLISSAFEAWISEEPGSASKSIREMKGGDSRTLGIKAIIEFCRRSGDKASELEWKAILENP